MAATITCLFQLKLVSAIAAASAGQVYEKQLQVLTKVISGPARGRPLALHLDAALQADVQRAVVDVEAVRRTPHLILSLNLTHSWRWQRQKAATAAFPHGSSCYMLHVVLWITPRPKLLQMLWLHWKPQNLLLFSLGSSPGAAVLRDEALNGVEKLALIGHLLAEADLTSDSLGVYTVLPFSGDVQLLGPWGHESFGSWEALFPDRFPSFEGYTFQLATWMIDFPYLYRKNPSSPQGTGNSIRVLETLSSCLNFSYTLTVEPPEPVYGGKVNGSWAGILGMIHKREKNFTINTFYLTPERFIDFDPSSYLTFSNTEAFLLTPQPLPMSMNLLRPFTFAVWATVASSFVLAVFSYMMLKRTAGIWGLTRYWGTSVWLQMHRSLVGQSVPDLPQAPRQRVFLVVWFLYCLVVTAAYTCNLVGIFTHPAYPQRIHTLQELTDSDFRLAKHDIGDVPTTLIRNPPNSLYRRGDLFVRQHDVVEAMLADTHALIETFSWYTVREPLLSGSLHWYFKKHTPWKHKFDDKIQCLVEAGLIQQWYKEEMAKLGDGGSDDSGDSNPRRGSGEDSLAPPLNLLHLQGAFYILGLAWVASGVVLLLELFTHRHEESRVGHC